MKEVFLMDYYVNKVMSIIKFLDGKKSYLLGVGAVLYGLLGLLLGYQTAEEAKNYIWAGLSVIALRAGISKQ